VTNIGAGAGLLTFVAFAAGLAVTGTFAAAKPLDAVLGAGAGREGGEIHPN
jgi:hypothetical protein